MQENSCPQCDKEVLPPLNRLVQDACGHKKCRGCLLEDEIGCKQCQILNGDANISKTVMLKKNNDHTPTTTEKESQVENLISSTSTTTVKQIENHTAVIKCNGRPKVSLDTVNYSNNNSFQNVIIKEESREPFPISKTANKSLEPPKLDSQTLVENVNVETTPLTQHCSKDFKIPSIEIIKQKTIKKELNSQTEQKPMKKKKIMEIPDHITVSTGPLSFCCNLCNKKFKTKGHVKYHRFCTGEQRPHKCSLCGKDFILKPQLELHLIKHRKEKPLTCNICQKSFYEPSKLKRHLQVHSEEKKFMCSECGKTYRTKEALQIHFSIHKGEKQFSCDLCTAKFNNSSNLKRHLVTHSAMKGHMCDLCGKTFKLKWALKVHRKSHTRIRDFQCEVCFKTFVLNKELQRHVLIHDDTTSYTCSICRTAFRRKDNLYRHIKNTHPGKKAEVIVEQHARLKPLEARSSTRVPRIKRSPVVVDNPNAINVITASPAFVKSKNLSVAVPRDESNVDIVDSRTVGTAGYNGPPKLAFKGPAFKMHYNIKRDCDYIHPAQVPHPINLSESVNICQQIMSPSTDYICPTSPTVDERTSTEICQKILCVDVSKPDKLNMSESVAVHQTSEYPYEFVHRIKMEPGLEVDPIPEESEINLLSPYTDHDDPVRTVDNEPFNESSEQEILGIQAPIPINLSESVNIYQKIMSPSTDYTYPTRNVDDLTFKEICQRILSPPLEIMPAPVPIQLSESVNICQRIMSPSTDYKDPTKNVDERAFKETCQRILSNSPPSDILCVPSPIQLSESVNIYQRIMSPSTDYTDPTKTVNERIFKETCQKILSIPNDPPDNYPDKNLSVSNRTLMQNVPSPYFSNYSSPRSDFSQYSSPGPSPRPGLPQYSTTLHYASSFQNQKHAVIKSIKFKVPREYTKTFKEQQQERQSFREDFQKNIQSSLKPATVIVNNSKVTH